MLAVAMVAAAEVAVAVGSAPAVLGILDSPLHPRSPTLHSSHLDSQVLDAERHSPRWRLRSLLPAMYRRSTVPVDGPCLRCLHLSSVLVAVAAVGPQVADVGVGWRPPRYKATRLLGQLKLVAVAVAGLPLVAVDGPVLRRLHGRLVLPAARLLLQVASAVDGDAGAKALVAGQRRRRPLRPPRQRLSGPVRAVLLRTCNPQGRRLQLLRLPRQLLLRRPRRPLHPRREPRPLLSLFQPPEACQEAPGKSSSWAAVHQA